MSVITSGKTPSALIGLRHPEYVNMLSDWDKWRLTFEGGTPFIEKYLKQFTKREDNTEFCDRKAMTYCPAFAKAAVMEIKNSIFQRMADVTRVDGSASYMASVAGKSGGVDLSGGSMTSFIGMEVLPELLSMGKVGVFIDMPPINGPTLLDQKGKHPYLYVYTAEDILNWLYSAETSELQAILLRDCDYKIDEETGFPTYVSERRYRHVWLAPEGMYVQFYTQAGEKDGEKELFRDIKKIPFALFEIPESLLTDVADYQVSLLNIASSDVAFSVRANFPLYTEQFDPRVDAPHLRQAAASMQNDLVAEGDEPVPGSAASAGAGKSAEIALGVGRGRRYPREMERPGFINPSPEPLMASMSKEDQMKREIRQLVHLSVSNMSEKMASAESKGYDERGLESGLSAIGLVLEKGERTIAECWSMYEKSAQVATVAYPRSYSLKSDTDRLDEADKLAKLEMNVPSKTFQRQVSKRISHVLLGHSVPSKIMTDIEKELDGSITINCDAKTLALLHEQGALSAETLAQIMGFPEGEAKKASAEHAERLARIAEHQAPAGGAPGAARIGDQQTPGDNKTEKKKPDAAGDKKKQRGDGKASGGEA